MNTKRIRLLLIEDDRDVAGLIRNMLRGVKDMEYEVRHTTSLMEGLAGLKDHPADLIVTDLGLPDSKGLASLIRVKVAAPDIPVIVLTALADGATAVDAMRRGSQDYLVKGRIDAITLDSSIRYALERHRVLQGSLAANETQFEAERDRIVVEMAGGVAHEINQPLTVMTLIADHFLSSMDPSGCDYDLARNLNEAAKEVDRIVKNLLNVKKYVTRPYVGGDRILDLGAAAGEAGTKDRSQKTDVSGPA